MHLTPGADAGRRHLPPVFQVLRPRPHRRKWEDLRLGACGRWHRRGRGDRLGGGEGGGGAGARGGSGGWGVGGKAFGVGAGCVGGGAAVKATLT
eukprot:scaffold5998_cov69-Isochrysis_galbana.AAC.3